MLRRVGSSASDSGIEVLLLLFGDCDDGGDTDSFSLSESSSSSASKDIPGKDTISKSMDSTPSSLRTRFMASWVWGPRWEAGMLGR